VKLLTGADVTGASALEQEDLVRSPRGTAVIGDPRNDENRIVSQIQLGMILFGTKLGRGFTPVTDADAVVDMHEIFNTSENRNVQNAEKLDTKLASILLDLPFVGAGDESSLATRNMLRSQSFLMPSGLGADVHGIGDILTY